MIDEAERERIAKENGCCHWTWVCPGCGSLPKEHKVENYDFIWGDGDVVCTKCGTRVRDYDRG